MKLLLVFLLIINYIQSHPIRQEIVQSIHDNTILWEPYEVQENPLSHLNEQQMKKLVSTNIPNYPFFQQEEPNLNLPLNFDSRQKWQQCIHPIRDQQQCGSCWAFAATEVFEDRLCIFSNGKINVTLSPQYIVSCDQKDHGCNGGQLSNVWQFLQQVGTVQEQCFPYKANDLSCPNVCNDEKLSMQKYKCQQNTIKQLNGQQQIMNEIFNNGPVETGFNVYEDFFNYQSGIYHHISGKYQGGHAVKIIGWGYQNALRYWICANSWGQNWGEQGLFRIQMGQCGIDNSAFACQPSLQINVEM